jgi:hypothetical protein
VSSPSTSAAAAKDVRLDRLPPRHAAGCGVISRQLGLDPSKPVIGLLTNVSWDAQLHYPANAFPNMLEGLRCRRAKYFASRPDLQLLISAADIRRTDSDGFVRPQRCRDPSLRTLYHFRARERSVPSHPPGARKRSSSHDSSASAAALDHQYALMNAYHNTFMRLTSRELADRRAALI